MSGNARPTGGLNIHELTLAQLGRAYRDGSLGPIAVAEALLERIEKLNPALHAFVRVTRERALGEAAAAEAALRAGQDRGPLHGIPYAVKDIFDVRGEPTMAGTHLLADNVAGEDCTAVAKLSRAGMVLLGKTHTVQLALGGSGINHDLGTPHNPWHRIPHTPGGSSSGSGVAVTTGLAPAALGSDTGGSVRIPAALTGCVGLKTTVGRISRHGVYPLSWSLDSVGPLTRTVEDAALVYDAMQGEDPHDETTLGVPPHDPTAGLDMGVEGLRIGIGETVFFDGADAELSAAVRKAAEVLAGLGARVESVELPGVARLAAEDKRRMFTLAESLAHHREWLADERREQMDWAVAQRLETGLALSATDYFRLTRLFAAERAGMDDPRRADSWHHLDAILAPTSVQPPLPVETLDASPEAFAELSGLYARNTSLGNALGWCGISVPCGFTSQGLPMGLLINAAPFGEAMALRVAKAYQGATEWHTRRPGLEWME